MASDETIRRSVPDGIVVMCLWCFVPRGPARSPSTQGEHMHNSVKVAIFSIDPPGLTTFHTFDPESFAVISLVNDASSSSMPMGMCSPASPPLGVAPRPWSWNSRCVRA